MHKAKESFKVSASCLLYTVLIWIMIVVFSVFYIFEVRVHHKHVFEHDINLPSYVLEEQDYHASIPGLVYPKQPLPTRYNETYYFKLGDLLKEWNPDDVNPNGWELSKAHPSKGQGLPRLDYSDRNHMVIAEQMRNMEIPFILYNIPLLRDTSSKHFSKEKLLENFGDSARSIELSKTNHFLYYSERGSDFHGKYSDWKPPQKLVEVTFSEFLERAEIAQQSSDNVASEKNLYYMTISAGEGWKTRWIRDSMPYFDPRDTFFIVDQDGFRGINCRFGMKGVAAAAHYDGGRNFVAMIRGRKRYILLPPDECPNMSLLPRGHPSARHSTIDWSDMSQVNNNQNFYNARATEVVLSQGEMLYIPSYWFHFIVSQDASIQCNARSGDSVIGRQAIADCGFYSSGKAPKKKNKKVIG